MQRTGWGKSVVYFIATRLLRDQGLGPTILISPLLSLMRDPVRMARARTLASIAHGIGLLVVDEAHCISDWGRDFRPDYRRIRQITQALPERVPLLATTATANDRVIADIEGQLGPSLVVVRGALALRPKRYVLREVTVEQLRIDADWHDQPTAVSQDPDGVAVPTHRSASP